MSHRQTTSHRKGKNSYHQIAFFTGQPIGSFEDDPQGTPNGKTALEKLLYAMSSSGAYDGVEIGSWVLDLARADDDEGAKAYARELVDLCRGTYELEIVSLATHLQGQCLGDRASVKTIQFQGGEVLAAYQAWLDEGNTPPEDDPYYVPPNVAEMSRQKSIKDQLAVGRLAQYIGEIEDRDVPVSSFVGSAGAWDDIFDFPPRPTKCGDRKAGRVEIMIGNRADYALSVIIQRFKPVWDFYKERGIKFGLESHPGEIAAGDIESSKRFIEATDKAGYKGTVGFNFDASHMVWQNVDPIAFIEEFIDYIWSVHHKGVQIRNWRRSRAGVFGGWVGFGLLTRFWDFVAASSNRDSTSPEDILVALNTGGWDGALTIEGEDTGFDLVEIMIKAAERLADIDLTPAGGLFDEAFTK